MSADGGDSGGADGSSSPTVKQKADFGLSGALAKDKAVGNTYKGVVLKWSEPPDARVPATKWRLYQFKKGEPFDKPMHIHRQSAFLVGRDIEIADIPVEHPSCSKQHAVLQFRLVEAPPKPDEPLKVRRVVKPYIMDLQSTNGTYLNGDRVDDSRYIELREKDTLRFGFSSREYVLMRAG